MFGKNQGNQAQDAVLGGKHAIVIGSSLAGLLAGRVLADHFAQVTIIERDALVDSPESRKGVPQGRHTHGLLSRGTALMADLFPGLFDDIQAAGGLTVDVLSEARWHQHGLWKMQTESGIIGRAQSRPLLEWKVRRRVQELPNVRILEATDAVRLVANEDQSRITGLVIRRRAVDAGEETLAAELVVDAGGRGSRTPQWLQDLGYGAVEETILTVNVGYATQIFRRSPGADDPKCIVVIPKAPDTRMGVIMAIEGDRWSVSLAGWSHDYPPTDNAGFLEYARSLPVPEIYNILKDAEALTPIVTHKVPSNQRRHYEKMARFPEGLAVLGDALCSFNPIYAQGITMAAVDVDELAQTLRAHAATHAAGDLTGLADVFRKRVAKGIETPWMMVMSEDSRYAAAQAQPSFPTRFMQWYMGRLHGVVAQDAPTAVLFMEVMNMLKPPQALFAPQVAWKVLTMRQPAPQAAAPRPATAAARPTTTPEVKRAA